ncbi:uncharacterized protein LODBEIA_P09530 [Lodderomyces beijingensis]|uniref:Uncharacterized protein n=1 Tax=Lodderomyces beijingensis TaxID=1775926 RepID=A0ABP0ZEZ5_9ASCO
MSSYIDVIVEEQNYVQDLLDSIPFSSDRTTHFLKIHKISHQQLNKLNDQPYKFPIEANKLLKLGISLGSLLRTSQVDEENYRQQHQQQRQFINRLNNAKAQTPRIASAPTPTTTTTRTGAGAGAGALDDPFSANGGQSQPPRHVIHSQPQLGTQSHLPHQVRFLRNLLTILKNFDIAAPPAQQQQQQAGNRESSASYGSNPYAAQRMVSNGSGSSAVVVNTSPIKLSSKQLLIEKLEINIHLDNLFIYKIILKLILEIYGKIRQSLLGVNEDEPVTPTGAGSAGAAGQNDEMSSIFSTASATSHDSSLSNEEYLKIVSNVLSRISAGVLQPFVSLIYAEFVETKITDDFVQLIDNL